VDCLKHLAVAVLPIGEEADALFAAPHGPDADRPAELANLVQPDMVNAIELPDFRDDGPRLDVEKERRSVGTEVITPVPPMPG
jgi:hypothetical protein